ncbi:MAG: hypothetical protein ACD_4C00399G0001 [uncultured bacterium (gcode 4)]|uniref:Large ribosomal subunit protein bL25 n=1 Tax=uncultured bacterium (gcode 4) TaxID=1234023 RepID=K2FTH2_9BACT|nr:MAG: hypothetical protein ACD_4C00399G0001 [uncultured bacterium (gcode 4)]
MEKLSLQSFSRNLDEKLSDIRSNKQIPAVVYGHKFASKSVKVGYSEFLKLFRVGGFTHIVELTIDGKKQDVLVHDLQKHPITWDFQHIDFMVLTAWEKIHVNIPVHLIGNAPAIKEWWMVDQILCEVEVKCLPKDLVDNFEIDISNMLNIWDVLHISDIKIDTKKFEIHLPVDMPVVSILEVRWAKTEETWAPEAKEVPASEQKDAD